MFRESAFFTGWTVRPLAIDQNLILTIALCIFNIFGLLFFLRGIQKAPVSIVVPVSALKVFTILTAVFVVGEVWKMPYLYAFVLSTGGLLFLYLEGSSHASSKEHPYLIRNCLSNFFPISITQCKTKRTNQNK